MQAHQPPDKNSVPPNRFGLTDHDELQRRETPLVLRRLLELELKPLSGDFHTRHLLGIHRYLFQDVYDWAGELRTVTISKPGAIFPPPQHLRATLDTIFAELARDKLLKSLNSSDWAKRAAYFLGEINAIHPFREGNGRAQREFIRELGLAAGHCLVWAACTQEEMIRASQLSMLRRDYSALEMIIRASIVSL